MSTDNLIIVTAIAWFLVGYALGWGRTVRKLRDVESRLKVAQRIIASCTGETTDDVRARHGLIAFGETFRDQLALRPHITYVGGPWDGDSHAMSAPPMPMLPIHGHAGCYRLNAEANAYRWEPD